MCACLRVCFGDERLSLQIGMLISAKHLVAKRECIIPVCDFGVLCWRTRTSTSFTPQFDAHAHPHRVGCSHAWACERVPSLSVLIHTLQRMTKAWSR